MKISIVNVIAFASAVTLAAFIGAILMTLAHAQDSGQGTPGWTMNSNNTQPESVHSVINTPSFGGVGGYLSNGPTSVYGNQAPGQLNGGGTVNGAAITTGSHGHK